MPTDYSVFALHNSTRLVWQNRVYWCLRQHWCLGPQAPQRGDPDNSRPVDRAVRVTIGTANLYGYVIQKADSNGRRNEMWSQYGVCRFTLPKQNRTRERRGIERESENESVTRPSGHLTNPSPDTMQVTTTFEITLCCPWCLWKENIGAQRPDLMVVSYILQSVTLHRRLSARFPNQGFYPVTVIDEIFTFRWERCTSRYHQIAHF